MTYKQGYQDALKAAAEVCEEQHKHYVRCGNDQHAAAAAWCENRILSLKPDIPVSEGEGVAFGEGSRRKALCLHMDGAKGERVRSG